MRVAVLRGKATWEGEGVALAALAFLLLVLLEPIVFRGHVAAPLENRRAFDSSEPDSRWPQMPRLADVNRYFVPKLQLHFQGDHAGWNATWNPHVQLGKPASHFGGYSKAYPITYLLSFFSTDPYRLHAWLSAVTVALLTYFSFFFLRSLSLHPAAAFVGAVGIGLNTRSAYWFGFAQFLSWAAWSIGILWLCVRLSRRSRPLDWLGLVFFCYCLLIGARHQATLRMAYLVVPFVLLIVLSSEYGWRRKLKTLGLIALGAAVAALLALPLLYDLATTMSQSTRFASDTREFVLADRVSFFEENLATLWNVFAFGNPSRADYPLRTSALNLTPFFFSLLAAAFVIPLPRRAWLFIAVFTVFLAMAVSVSVHSFAIGYLGFGFSRGSPVGGLYVPAFVLCAYAADALLGDPARRRIGALRPAAAAFCAAALGTAAVLLPHPHERIHWGHFALGLALAGLALAFTVRRSPILLYCAAALVVFSATAPALVHRPLSEVVRSSPLIELFEDQTRGRYRLAKFGRATSFLPSNQEVLVGLRSIHSYDSISSSAYGRWAATVSDSGAQTHGRLFGRLDATEKLTEPAMSYTGVKAIVSDQALPLPGWSVRTVAEGRFLYVALEPPRLVAQIADFDVDAAGSVTLAGALGEHSGAGRAEVVSSRDDVLKVRIRPAPRESLLFVSSQYHRDWVARSARSTLRTLRVNDFYLGVLLPAGTEEVELRFEPLARWAWIPLAAFATAFAAIAVWHAAGAAPIRASRPPAGRE